VAVAGVARTRIAEADEKQHGVNGREAAPTRVRKRGE